MLNKLQPQEQDDDMERPPRPGQSCLFRRDDHAAPSRGPAPCYGIMIVLTIGSHHIAGLDCRVPTRRLALLHQPRLEGDRANGRFLLLASCTIAGLRDGSVCSQPGPVHQDSNGRVSGALSHTEQRQRLRHSFPQVPGLRASS